MTTRPLTKSLLIISLLALTACGGSEDREAKYLERAKQHFDSLNFDKARVEVKNVLQINPKNGDARVLLSKLLRESGDFKQAYSNLLLAIEESPDNLSAHKEIGKIYFAGKQDSKSEEHLNKVLQQKPNDKDALIILAGIELRKENTKKAEGLAKQVLDQHPGEPGAISVLATIHAKTNTQKSHAYLDEGLAIHPTSEMLKNMKIRVHLQDNEHNKVEKLYLQLINEHPQKLGYYSQLAKDYTKKKNLSAAEAILHKAIKNNPDEISAKIALIRFTSNSKGFEEAVVISQSFIRSDAENYQLNNILGQLYLSNNKVNEAIEHYTKIVTASPSSTTSVKARNTLIKIYLLQRKKDKAEQLISEVLEIEPGNTQSLIFRAQSKLAKNRIKDAISDLRAALKTNEESITALSLLAKAQELEGSYSLAIDNYRKVIALSNNHTEAYVGAGRLSLKKKEDKQAQLYLEEALRRDEHHAIAITLLSQIYAQKNQWDKAYAIITPILNEKNPNYPVGLVAQAELKKAQKQTKEAQALYLKAIERQNNMVEAISGYISTYTETNDFSAAIDFLEEHTAKNPEQLFAQDILASIYQRNGNTPKSIEIYKALLDVTPKNESLYSKLASAYIRDKKGSQAQKTLLKGLDVNENFVGLRVFLADLYQTDGNFEKAKKQYEMALETHPKLMEAQNNLAILLVNHFPAEDSYQKALTLTADLAKSRQAVYLDTLGWVHYKLNNLPQAISYLQAAIEQEPKAPEFHYHLGMAHLQSKQVELAKTHLLLATASSQEYFGKNEAIDALKTL